MIWYALPMQCDGAPPQAYQEKRLSMQVVCNAKQVCVTVCCYTLQNGIKVGCECSSSMYFRCLQCSFSEQLDWSCELIAAVMKDAGVNLWTCCCCDQRCWEDHLVVFSAEASRMTNRDRPLLRSVAAPVAGDLPWMWHLNSAPGAHTSLHHLVVPQMYARKLGECLLRLSDAGEDHGAAAADLHRWIPFYRLHLRYTFPRIHRFAELGQVPES